MYSFVIGNVSILERVGRRVPGWRMLAAPGSRLIPQQHAAVQPPLRPWLWRRYCCRSIFAFESRRYCHDGRHAWVDLQHGWRQQLVGDWRVAEPVKLTPHVADTSINAAVNCITQKRCLYCWQLPDRENCACIHFLNCQWFRRRPIWRPPIERCIAASGFKPGLSRSHSFLQAISELPRFPGV